jgi:hypothetical protein
MLSRVDHADTWADGSVQSPYSDEFEPDEPPSRTERKPPVVAAVPDESLTIDVDVPFDAPSPRPPPVASETRSPRPQAAAQPIARSGVRGPAADSDDEPDDAPQFFDRRALETLGTQSGEVPIVATRHALTGPSLARTPATSLLARSPIAWAAIAFIAVGLVVAVALALR